MFPRYSCPNDANQQANRLLHATLSDKNCIFAPMARKAVTYGSRPASGFLTFLLLGFWLMKALHPLLEHHHSHEDHPVCTAAERDRSVHHLHDERYATDECSVCAFVLSTQECAPSVSGFVLCHDPSTESTTLNTISCYFSASYETACPRGPPAC